ncbi:MAG: hypothetical protein KBC34_00485 [Phenylobacterium sp.]|nr:hypothetical protein [Phenylobacterium sp.]
MPRISALALAPVILSACSEPAAVAARSTRRREADMRLQAIFILVGLALGAAAPSAAAQGSLLEQAMRANGMAPPAARPAVKSANEAQVEPVARRALAAQQAFDAGLDALNQAWVQRIKAYPYCGFGWGREGVLTLQFLLIENQAGAVQLPALRAMQEQSYVGEILAQVPQAPARFDFSQVPQRADPQPVLAKLDGMFGEAEAICRRRGAPDGRTPEHDAADAQAVLDLGGRLRAEAEAYRQAIKRPVLEAIAAARPIGG